MKKVYLLIMLALGWAYQAGAQAPFNCTSGSILTVSNDTLYTYKISNQTVTQAGAGVFIDTSGWNIPSTMGVAPSRAATINAIAYDTISNTVWGVISNGNNYVGLVQIGSDGKTKLLSVANPNFTVETTLGTTSPNISNFTAIRWTVGEIHNGYLYLSAGGSIYASPPNASPLIIIDINPNRPATYLNALLPLNLGTPIASGTETQFNINTTYGALGDWVYMPANGNTLIQDALIYISTNTSNVSTLAAIAVVNGSASVMATYPQIVGAASENGFGSLFTDGNGNLYAKGNTTGNLYQIDIPTSTTATSVQATLIGNIGVTASNIPSGSTLYGDNNDGTGCLVSSKSLPITLQSFTVNANGNTASVQWTTTMEINNKGFYVERSTDGQNWQDITFVASKAENGNSSTPLHYQYTDQKPQQGYNYYRLKQISLNGAATFSGVQSVLFSNIGTRVYPNPTNGTLHVTVGASGTYRLVNAGGVVALKGSLQSGNNLLNVTGLTSGIYFMQIVSDKNVKNTYQIRIK